MLKSSAGKVDYKVLYSQAVFGEEEIEAVVTSLDNGWLAHGVQVEKFEKEVAKLFGKKYGIAVNSGSSANLLALSWLSKGGEVITPALTFSTTVSSILLNGLIPVFCDGLVGRYTINEEQIEKAINEKTVAIMVPQLVGGVCDMEKLSNLADEHQLILIDDSCDTFAPTFNGKPVATYADITTTSFYGSHIITACGIGGMIMTDYIGIKNALVTARDWGRVGNDAEEFEERFSFKIDNIPYDSKFVYSSLGYNLKMNEVSAAFGLEQLKRLPEFTKIRKRNFAVLYDFFIEYDEWFYMPQLLHEADTTWLAFPLTIKPGAPFTRYDLLKYLDSKGIQVRVLFAGNILRHSAYKGLDLQSPDDFPVADEIMGNGFLLGCHQGLTQEDVYYVCDQAKEFFNAVKNG